MKNWNDAVYLYPSFSAMDFGFFRFLGPGLGNLLLPWARCQIAANQGRGELLSSTWPQVKVGPWIRGEPDKRSYVGHFCPEPGSLSGAKKALILAAGRRIKETEDLPGATRPVVRLFSGLGRRFEDLSGENDFLRERLLSISRSRHLPLGSRTPYVAVHVRRGDFAPDPDRGASARGETNRRLPISWYMEALSVVSRGPFGGLPVWLVTDGEPSELEPLIRAGANARSRSSALADLWFLADASLVVASASSFSAWACFLGNQPAIWPSSQVPPGVFDEPNDRRLTVIE